MQSPLRPLVSPPNHSPIVRERLPVKENLPPPSLRAIHFHHRSTPCILKNYLELTSIINDCFDEVGEVGELEVRGFQIPGGIVVNGLK